ncbi:MAG: hypothetical protein P1U64_11285 [Alcanivoracaceae bacterium]|nr:hypothetical protein [Alcanivoracaceae bacterium]
MKRMSRHYFAAVVIGLSSVHANAADEGISLTIGAGMASVEDAEVFYAIDTDKGDAALPAEYDEGDNILIDATAPLSALGLGDSGLRAGLRYQSSKTSTDESVGRYDDPASPCNISPTLGVKDNCWNQGSIDIETEATTLALYLETDMDVGERLTLTPRVGLVEVSFDEERDVGYLYEGGTSTLVDDDSSFSGVGLLLGADLVQQQEQFFWGAGLEMTQVSSTRRRDIVDLELQTPPGSFSDLNAAQLKSDVTVTTLTIGAHIGKRFDLSGTPVDVVLAVDHQSMSNILDTRNTQADIYPRGSLGDKNDSFDTLNYGIQVRTSF